MRKLRALFERRKRPRPRRYIPADLGVDGFFDALNADGAKYVVLRWHETLPQLSPGEDIDLLIADDALALVETLLTGSKYTGIPVDLYTVGGLSGTEYCTVAYFIPQLANQALENSVLYKSRYRIPGPESYFFTMCYHVVYHKGLRSGLPAKLGDKSEEASDHDYQLTIAQLAKSADLPVPEMSLTALDKMMSSRGFRPSSDTMRKYSMKNTWLGQMLATNAESIDEVFDGLAVFIVRERARALTEAIVTLLRDNGFQPIAIENINDDILPQVAARLRGGNWNRGPHPVSGGKPAVAIVAFDCFPRMCATRDNPLETSNASLALVKERVRKALQQMHPETRTYNTIHSSDCPIDALEYLATIDDRLEERCRDEAKRIMRDVKHPFKVVERLDGLGRRAKVERVIDRDATFICKSFRPGMERFMERESLARELVGEDAGIVPIISRGANYILLQDVGESRQQAGLRPFGAAMPFLPVTALLACRKLISHFRQKGYELIDFAPQNILFDDQGRCHFIDFEFLQPGLQKTSALAGNYAWWWPPDTFQGDYPKLLRNRDIYSQRWLKRTGLPRMIYANFDNRALYHLFRLCFAAGLSMQNAMYLLFGKLKKIVRGL